MQNLAITFTKTLLTLSLLLIIAVTDGRLKAQTIAPGGAYLKHLEEVLFIVRVDYLLYLKDPENPESYGREGRKYFGRAAGLAFVSDGRLWFDERLTKPWQYFDQANYNRYKRDTLLEPRVSEVSIRRVSDKKFIKLNDNFIGAELGPVSTWVLPDSLAKPTMFCLPDTKDTNGLLVIASLDKGEDLNKENFQITLTSTQPKRGCNLEEGKNEWRFPGALDGGLSTLGGIWLVYKDYPQGEGIRGVYALKAAGIGKQAGLDWQIMPLPKRFTEGKRDELNSVKKPTQSETGPEKKKRNAGSEKSSAKGNTKSGKPTVNPIENRSSDTKPKN